MSAANPFAEVPATPEPVIAQVRRQLADDDQIAVGVTTGVLDRIADHAVRELWSSRVKTFVPVLALREAREILRSREVRLIVERSEMRDVVRDRPVRGDSPPRDVLLIDDDVLTNDYRDVLPL